MANEMELSQSRGSLDIWKIAEQYEVLDDAIVPIGKENERWKSYFPFIFPELPAQFAKLKNGDEKAILEFVHKWGLLGHSNLVDVDTPEPHEALRRKGPHGGDPIDWISLHAKTVDRMLSVLDSLQRYRIERQPKSLWDDIWNLARESSTPGALAGIEFARGSFTVPETYFIMGDPDKPDEAVANLLKTVLVPNISYLKESLIIRDDYTIDRSKSFPALLPVVYSHLADAAAGQRRYVRCKYKQCGNYFLQEDPRQLYCPHPVPKNESLCSLKARKRKYQANISSKKR